MRALRAHFLIRLPRLLAGTWALGLWTLSALAGPPVQFGPEFTFTNDRLIDAGRKAGSGAVNTEENLAALEAYVDRLRQVCPPPECQVTSLTDKYGLPFYRIYHKDFFYIDATLDPWVVEVKLSPQNPDGFRTRGATVQRLVFDVARVAGLAPQARTGGGHVHIDVASAFGEDARLFRNFIVDLANFSALGHGVLGQDLHNAAQIVDLRAGQIEAFRQVIDEFDRNPTMTIRELATEIQTRVYRSHPHPVSPPEKYMGVNLTRIVNGERGATLEIRYIRPQNSAEDFDFLMRMFQGRIEYLKTVPGFVPVVLAKGAPTNMQAATRFWEYLHPTGVPFEEGRAYLKGTDLAEVWPDPYVIYREMKDPEEFLRYSVRLYAERPFYPLNFLKVAGEREFPNALTWAYAIRVAAEKEVAADRFTDDVLRNLVSKYAEFGSAPSDFLIAMTAVYEKLPTAQKTEFTKFLPRIRAASGGFANPHFATLFQTCVTSFKRVEMVQTLVDELNASDGPLAEGFFESLRQLEARPSLHVDTRALIANRVKANAHYRQALYMPKLPSLPPEPGFCAARFHAVR